MNNWRKFIARAGKHAESVDHKQSYSDAGEIIAADDSQQDTIQEKLVKASEVDKEKPEGNENNVFSHSLACHTKYCFSRTYRM